MNNIIVQQKTANNNAIERIRLHDTVKPCIIALLFDSKPSRTTNNYNMLSHALKLAFFVPKNRQGWLSSKGINPVLGIKNQVLIAIYGRVKAWNTIPNLLGNICSRVVAISDTRPPVTKAGGITKTTMEGNKMSSNPNLLANNSQNLAVPTTKSPFFTKISLYKQSNGITATIHTKHNQKLVIGRVFASIAQLKQFLKSQNINPVLSFGGAL